MAPLRDILPEYSHILDLLNFREQPANQQPACHSCQFNTARVTPDRNQTHLQRQTVGNIWRILEDTPPDCSHYQRTEIIRVYLQKTMNKKSHQLLLPPGWRWQFKLVSGVISLRTEQKNRSVLLWLCNGDFMKLWIGLRTWKTVYPVTSLSLQERKIGLYPHSHKC